MAAPRHPCPHCLGTGYRQSPLVSDAEIEAIAVGLRAACRDAGAAITGDDRVDEATAAMLVGRKTKTLRNWRHTHRPIPFMERYRRISYAVSDLARWMHENSNEPYA